MEDSKPCNLPTDMHRRGILKSIPGIAAASAFHPTPE
jgi:hypothetical protein